MRNITIAGNIGKDAQIRTTQNGDKITGWSVAVEAGYGQNKKTQWYDCSWFGSRGEKVAPYLTKGSKITVSGEFDTREHDGKTYLQISVNNVTLQGGGKQDGGDRGQSGGGYDQSPDGYGGHHSQGGYGGGSAYGAGTGGAGGAADMNDEIPFACDRRL